MRSYELIKAKRDGAEMAPEAIRALLAAYLRDEVSDAEMTAWLMAVYFRGMSARETAALTMAMVESGDTLDLRTIQGVKVDKHSTGGVGDKTSLVLVPLAAAAGVRVPKLSGRALGHTGGTLDKLEAIPGLRVELTPAALIAQVNRIGCAIAGQSERLVPADRRLYALRDRTATVDSVPLIASSVMSKKIAAGSDAIVLDVKTGSGAFMKTLPDARSLAEAMVAIGREVDHPTVAVISRMDQPLGEAIGNALEVREAVRTLRGAGPPDLTALCLALGAEMLVLGGAAPDRDAARRTLEGCLTGGAAARKLAELVAAQGGDARAVEDPDWLPQAPVERAVPAPAGGVVAAIDAEALGHAAIGLGAGRARAGDRIDPGAGLMVHRKVGDAVERGAPLATLYTSRPAPIEEAARRVTEAYRIVPEGPGPAAKSAGGAGTSAPPLVLDVIR